MITFENCKGYDIITVSKRKAMKEKFFEDLSSDFWSCFWRCFFNQKEDIQG